MCSSGVWKKQQRLLKNMGAHKVMLDLLQVSYDQVRPTFKYVISIGMQMISRFLFPEIRRKSLHEFLHEFYFSLNAWLFSTTGIT